MVSCLPIWYFQKSFNGTFPFLPPSKYKLGPCRTEACLLLEVGTLASGLEGTTEVHMVHLQKKTANYKISKSSPLGGQVWRGTNANCFFFSQAEVMLFLPHLSGSALDMIQKYGHHFYTAPVNTTTTGLPLKGRQFLFSFLFCWYKQHCCVMYPIIITFTQYCVPFRIQSSSCRT